MLSGKQSPPCIKCNFCLPCDSGWECVADSNTEPESIDDVYGEQGYCRSFTYKSVRF